MSRMQRKRKNKNRLLMLFLTTLVLFAGGFALAWHFLGQTREAASSTAPFVSQSSKAGTQVTTRQENFSSTIEVEKESLVKLDASQLLANATSVQYGVHYFKSNQQISSNNSAPTPAASVIKAFIMAYYYQGIVAGKLSADTQIQGQSLENWLYPMIQKSDNEAANVLIDYAGMPELNQFFADQGYQDTRIERRMLDFAAQQNGQENYTSLDDCLNFLNQLYQNQESYPYVQMLEIMKGQQVRTKIPSQLADNAEVANKTGELAGVENDIGIVFDPERPFAVVVLSNGVYISANMRQAIGAFALQAQNGGSSK